MPRRLLARGPLIALAAVLVALAAGLGLGASVLGSSTNEANLVLKVCKPGVDAGCTARSPIHVHADFALFVDGKQFEFNQPQFISGTTPDTEKSPIVHIHLPHTTVVHVHLSGTTWDEFFSSLGFQLNDPTLLPGLPANQISLKLPNGQVLKQENGKTFKFYLNGVRVNGVAKIDIGDIDRMLISYGSETEQQVKDQQLPQVTDQACIPSLKCPDRIDPNEPPEACSGAGTCS